MCDVSVATSCEFPSRIPILFCMFRHIAPLQQVCGAICDGFAYYGTQNGNQVGPLVAFCCFCPCAAVVVAVSPYVWVIFIFLPAPVGRSGPSGVRTHTIRLV